jgi:hypothetical protein
MSGQIKLKAASLGGDITLTPTDTASNLVVTIPAVTATLLNNQSNIEAQVKTATNASGSAPIYSCRAWVNFNGTGTVAIRASGNVSSITDGGAGIYTVNFATAMQDADYAAVAGGPNASNGTWITYLVTSTQTASTLEVIDAPSAGGGGGRVDHALVNVAVFR